MFIVKLDYTAPLDEIDRLMDQHVQFLKTCFEAGIFIAAGRQNPRVGGIILAQTSKRSDLEAVMNHDPFVIEGAASFEIIEFRTSLHVEGFAPFADKGTRVIR